MTLAAPAALCRGVAICTWMALSPFFRPMTAEDVAHCLPSGLGEQDPT